MLFSAIASISSSRMGASSSTFTPGCSLSGSRGRVRRAISVIKKRTSAHEDTIREYKIDSQGITIGQPLMMLNVLERRFVLLGVVFRPQDFFFVVLLALTFLVTVLIATVVVGRVWCGWLCPQTVFMEMLFRKLEYLIEGSAEQQLRREYGINQRDGRREQLLGTGTIRAEGL